MTKSCEVGFLVAYMYLEIREVGKIVKLEKLLSWEDTFQIQSSVNIFGRLCFQLHLDLSNCHGFFPISQKAFQLDSFFEMNLSNLIIASLTFSNSAIFPTTLTKYISIFEGRKFRDQLS